MPGVLPVLFELLGSGAGNFTAAWDGYVQTFFDLPYPDGGWTQASLAHEQLIARIEWWPRAGFLDRPLGGQFVGLTASKHVRRPHDCRWHHQT